MIKALGIIILVVILSIAIPTRDKWSYKVMHDRNLDSDTVCRWDEKNEVDRYRKKKR